MSTLLSQESAVLRYLRGIACILIVACHFCQSSGLLEYTFLLNIGVQIFFCISGFLYGHKEISSWKEWCIGRMKKLYLPFILFCLPVITYVAIRYGGITWINFLAYLTMGQVVYGEVLQLAHLWFISAIVICYLFTPVLQYLRKWSDTALVVLIIATIIEYSFIHYRLFHYSWLFLYSFAYFFANSKYKKVYAAFSALILIGIVACFDISAYAFDELPHRLSHDFGALSLLVLVTFASNRFSNINVLGFFRWLDKYSMPIYIVHGAVVVEVMNNNLLHLPKEWMIPVALVFILILAWGLETVSTTIMKRVSK